MRQGYNSSPSPLKPLLRHLPAAVPWLIVGLCAGLPVAWMAIELLTRSDVWHVATPDAFRWKLIGRTFALDALAAGLATSIAVPVALAIAGRFGRWLWLVLPVPLLLPSLVLTYGWSQAFNRAGIDVMPQGATDVARCVIALASWLWPAPAMLVAFAARRLDANVIQQARLDGATGRIVGRSLAGPIVIGFGLAMLLAIQEFAIFEPTGISVIATEVRAVFETGASLNGSWSPTASRAQPARTAAALAVMLPALVLTAGLLIAIRRLFASIEADAGEQAIDAAPPTLPTPARLGAIVVGLAIVGVPVVAMLTSLRNAFNPIRVAQEYAPQLIGSGTLALITAVVAIAVSVAASIRRPSRWLVALALAGFLIGGQWAAIALIHVFNRPWLFTIYDSPALAIIAYTCRFGWIALIAATLTWSPRLRSLRELAATDGATPWATWRYVIAPATWPLLVGGVVLIFTLSLTEVPATTLLQPADTLVPMLMTWAHILNYDAMIEASLLLAIVVLTLGTLAAALVRGAVRRW